jgi:hypothetical protein
LVLVDGPKNRRPMPYPPHAVKAGRSKARSGLAGILLREEPARVSTQSKFLRTHLWTELPRVPGSRISQASDHAIINQEESGSTLLIVVLRTELFQMEEGGCEVHRGEVYRSRAFHRHEPLLVVLFE